MTDPTARPTSRQTPEDVDLERAIQRIPDAATALADLKCLVRQVSSLTARKVREDGDVATGLDIAVMAVCEIVTRLDDSGPNPVDGALHSASCRCGSDNQNAVLPVLMRGLASAPRPPVPPRSPFVRPTTPTGIGAYL